MSKLFCKCNSKDCDKSVSCVRFNISERDPINYAKVKKKDECEWYEEMPPMIKEGSNE